jgi:hypothetical protein
VTGLGFGHFIEEGPLFIDVSTFTSPLTVVPSTTASNMLFSIGHWGEFSTDNFDTFAAFETQLATDLNGTTPIIGIYASGSYDSTTGTFTATHIVVVLGSSSGS